MGLSQRTAVVNALLLLAAFVSAVHASDAVDELVKLRQRSSDKIIRLDEGSYSRFLESKEKRPFSFVLFFDAANLHDNTQLNLPALRKEFALIAAAFSKHNEGSAEENAVFFGDIEFKHSTNVFQKLMLNSLPHIRVYRAGKTDKGEAYPFPENGREVEHVVEWIEQQLRIKVGAIERPPPITKLQLAILVSVVLICAPFVIRYMLTTQTMFHSPALWCTGGLFIYFFSVSGGMFNIIRGMPFSIPNQQKPGVQTYFYNSGGMQLGAEGFTIGSSYTAVGLLVAFCTHMVPKIKSKYSQRFFVGFCLLIAFNLVKFVVGMDHWKTGYSVHPYFPSWMHL